MYQVSKVVAELAGKNLEELIAEGKKKTASVPSGGAAPAAGGAGQFPALDHCSKGIVYSSPWNIEWEREFINLYCIVKIFLIPHPGILY